MTLYDRVKQLADERSMSIAAVERQADLGGGTIGGWRKKDTHATVGSVGRVAAVYGMTIDQLITGVE